MPIDKLPEIPSSKKVHAGEPGEFEDGRMGADIQNLITDITDKRNLLAQHTAEDKENLAAIETEIELIEYRMMKIESRVEKRTKAKSEYEETYAKTEAAFQKIVTTANAVANILEPPTKSDLGAMKEPAETKKVKVPQKFDEVKAKQTEVENKIAFSKADSESVKSAGKLE